MDATSPGGECCSPVPKGRDASTIGMVATLALCQLTRARRAVGVIPSLTWGSFRCLAAHTLPIISLPLPPPAICLPLPFPQCRFELSSEAVSEILTSLHFAVPPESHGSSPNAPTPHAGSTPFTQCEPREGATPSHPSSVPSATLGVAGPGQLPPPSLDLLHPSVGLLPQVYSQLGVPTRSWPALINLPLIHLVGVGECVDVCGRLCGARRQRASDAPSGWWLGTLSLVGVGKRVSILHGCG